MTVRVALENYTVLAKHGYYEYEHEQDQPFVFTVSATLLPGDIKNLEHTLNYADIQVAIDQVMFGSNKPIALMETMAHEVITLIRKNRNVAKMSVRIEKPDAPLPHEGGLAVVEVDWLRK